MNYENGQRADDAELFAKLYYGWEYALYLQAKSPGSYLTHSSFAKYIGDQGFEVEGTSDFPPVDKDGLEEAWEHEAVATNNSNLQPSDTENYEFCTLYNIRAEGREFLFCIGGIGSNSRMYVRRNNVL